VFGKESKQLGYFATVFLTHLDLRCLTENLHLPST
jgi:hypothetical protein